MADVKWIKIYTNMVSNKKIKRIRTLPEGNNIVLIWVFLLAQAGESNKNGSLYLTDTLPFRPEDLAIEFDFEVPVINLALITLEKFSMIEVFDEVIYIKNWGEYQNIDGMDKIREQTRIRTAIYREKRKQLPGSDATCDVTVTHGDAIELDKELDKELELDIEDIPYGEIVSYLNSETSSKYKSSSSKTRGLIKARWNDGFRLDDFKSVIAKKCSSWSNNPDMVKFLRPETLFGTKFESYLNEKIITQGVDKQGKPAPRAFQSLQDWANEE
ncbi:MAG: phage replisome organizer N-terminal domain-containing protein [Desulfosporosinus sp.]|nr:phage replisome organizer N-terminal domain-containing protein [Desulfosporosinus sp.]